MLCPAPPLRRYKAMLRAAPLACVRTLSACCVQHQPLATKLRMLMPPQAEINACPSISTANYTFFNSGRPAKKNEPCPEPPHGEPRGHVSHLRPTLTACTHGMHHNELQLLCPAFPLRPTPCCVQRLNTPLYMRPFGYCCRAADTLRAVGPRHVCMHAQVCTVGLGWPKAPMHAKE